jgi:hypothetical protein
MKNKKYKHKITGNIAVETTTEKNYKVTEPRHFTIPKWVVENSNDWEEIVEKQPLFTTEDGKEIFEGDSVYWFLRSSTDYLYKINFVKDHLELDFKNIYAIFSTKEAGEEYFIYNKPVLSLNDVASIYPGINKTHNSPSHQAEQLKQLVRNKLKL